MCSVIAEERGIIRSRPHTTRNSFTAASNHRDTEPFGQASQVVVAFLVASRFNMLADGQDTIVSDLMPVTRLHIHPHTDNGLSWRKSRRRDPPRRRRLAGKAIASDSIKPPRRYFERCAQAMLLEYEGQVQLF